MLLALPYLLAAAACRGLVEDGRPGWLHLLVILFIWNAMKLTIMGPVSLILLIRARIQEAAARRSGSQADRVETHESVEFYS